MNRHEDLALARQKAHGKLAPFLTVEKWPGRVDLPRTVALLVVPERASAKYIGSLLLGLPEDAIIEALDYCFWEARTYVRIWSKGFPEIETEGGLLPRLLATVEKRGEDIVVISWEVDRT